jgi:DNA-binding CsgD family transcriptional regulator
MMQRYTLAPLLRGNPEDDLESVIVRRQSYTLYTVVYCMCLHTVAEAVDAGKDLPSILEEAVAAMRNVLCQSVLMFMRRMMFLPDPEIQTAVLVQLSAWAATQITLKNHPGGGNRLTEALLAEIRTRGEAGQSPFSLLLKVLPTNVYQAFAKPWGTLQELRNTIVALIQKDITGHTLQEHVSPESLHKAQQEIADWDTLTSSLAAWRAMEEVRQELDRVSQQAGLSPREAEVITLRRQGLTQKQIGIHLTVPRDQVKIHEKRATQKMRTRTQR